MITLSDEEQEVLRTVMYMDAMGHPLKPSEVHQFTTKSMSPLNVVPCINYLVNHGLLSQTGNFISVTESAEAVEQRKVATINAEKAMSAAKTMARFANRFPFVRGVALVGGSVVGLPSDRWPLSILIITKKGKLWRTRYLLDITRKFLPAYKQRAFDTSFMFEEGAEEWPQKDRFTALITVGMLPLYGEETINAFQRKNAWAKEVLPNFKPVSKTEGLAGSKSGLKSFFEAWLGLGLFRFLDRIAKNKLKRQVTSSKSKSVDFEVDHGPLALPVIKGEGAQLESAYQNQVDQFQKSHHTDLNTSVVNG